MTNIELQERAIKKACRKLNLDGNTKYVSHKNDTSTYADKIANFFYHKDMIVKKSFMNCNNLDMTFFFNQDGKAVFSYSGVLEQDSIEDLTKAFQRAGELVKAMDEAMAELTQERERQDEIELE